MGLQRGAPVHMVCSWHQWQASLVCHMTLDGLKTTFLTESRHPPHEPWSLWPARPV